MEYHLSKPLKLSFKRFETQPYGPVNLIDLTLEKLFSGRKLAQDKRANERIRETLVCCCVCRVIHASNNLKKHAQCSDRPLVCLLMETLKQFRKRHKIEKYSAEP